MCDIVGAMLFGEFEMTNNTWPNGHRHAITQANHAKWNSCNYPGTIEICYKCDEPTGNCEEDNIVDEARNAYCYDCAKSVGLIER